jgi:membrane protease YdiL (CAAX protease family)
MLGSICRVKPFIRSLSAPAEFCLVLFVAFGLDYAHQIWTIAHGRPILIHDRLVLPGLGLDLLKLGIVLWIGRIRGWSVFTFGWRISWKHTAAGIVLYVVTTIAKNFVVVLLAPIHSQQPSGVVFEITLPVIFLLAVINPFYEEFFEAGYFIHSLQRFGMWPAILASSLFRGLLHVYQGIDGLVAMFVMGILYGLLYWRWRQLWPLVIAHTLDDFLGLLYVTHHAA